MEPPRLPIKKYTAGMTNMESSGAVIMPPIMGAAMQGPRPDARVPSGSQHAVNLFIAKLRSVEIGQPSTDFEGAVE